MRHRFNINRQHPAGGIPRHVRVIPVPAEPGVVDEHVYMAGLSDAVKKRRAFFCAAEVSNNRLRPTAGRFNLAVQEISTRQMQMLTDSKFDESPSFAPNGRMILYATEINGRGILSLVSSDGQVRQRLSSESGDIREPVWGPMLKQR